MVCPGEETGLTPSEGLTSDLSFALTPFHFFVFLLSSSFFICRTQCKLYAADESFEKNYKVQREKGDILTKDKFKTPHYEISNSFPSFEIHKL